MMFKNIFSKNKANKEDFTLGNEIDAGTITLEKVEKIIKTREKITNEEFERGYNLIKKYPRSVSIFGSARFNDDSTYCKKAESLTRRIVKELKYAVVTGGGPGIMGSANKGAFEAGGVSIGFTIKLPSEQRTNKYVTDSADFEYFFSRKTLIFFAAETYIFFPGGFGTLDEFFELITLIQTKKITKTPVILVGREFWAPFLELIEEKLLKENHTINKEDIEIYKIIDSEDEIINIIKNAPYRQD